MNLSKFGHFSSLISLKNRRFVKIYTRAGDQGTTFLNSETGRLPKQAPIFHALGDIDELSSSLG